MLPIIRPTATTALVILPALLGSPGPSDPAGFTANSTRTEVAANLDPAQSESGIAGQVNIRPVRPHETIGVPNMTPYQGKFEVLDPSGRAVTTFETDPNGNFRVALPPGRYVLRAQSSGPYPRASDQTVIVSPKRYTQVHVIYDSGIR
jgi:hypothetical protein